MFEEQRTEVSEERNSRKQPLSDDDVRSLLGQVSTVWVAKGKKTRRLTAEEASADDLKGPTGNYRAPMVRVEDRLLVGFNPDSLRRLLDGRSLDD